MVVSDSWQGSWHPMSRDILVFRQQGGTWTLTSISGVFGVILVPGMMYYRCSGPLTGTDVLIKEACPYIRVHATPY